MVTEHGVKTHAILKQLRKGLLEVLREVTPVSVGVNVVAGGDHKIERRPIVSVEHLAGHAVGVISSSSPVTNHRKSDCALGGLSAKDGGGPNESARCDSGKGLNRLPTRDFVHVLRS